MTVTKKIFIVGAILACLLTAWIYSETASARAVRPPPGATNLVAFLEAKPQLTNVCRFVHNGKVCFEVIGIPSISPLSLPSGPPAYIFDETGAFVDWSADIGDNPSFLSKWGGFTSASSISTEEARHLVVKGKVDNQ